MYRDCGLPNVEGTITSKDTLGTVIPQEATQLNISGAFANVVNSVSRITYANNGSLGIGSISFDASNCSTVYGKSSVVQPASLTMCCYIKY